MHAKGSNFYIGSTRIQTPRKSSSNFPNLPQQKGFALSQQHVISQVGSSTDWHHSQDISLCRVYIRDKISEILHSNVHHEQAGRSISAIAATVENELFNHAASKEEFMNQQTLLQRVQAELIKGRQDSQQQVHSSILYKTVHTPTVSGMASNNKHGFPNGPCISSIVNELVFPPHEGLASTTTSTCMDELSQIFSCGGGRNFAASTQSIGFRFPQQHANNLGADNRHDFQNGTFNHSIVHEPVFHPHEGSASTAYSGMDELSQMLTSGGGRNQAASSKSIGFSFPQQHANNLTTDSRQDINHSTVQVPVFPPHEGSASTTYTSMDELSQIFNSGGGRNQAVSSKSFGFSLPQRHADDLAMDVNRNGNCLGTVQKNESLALHTATGKSLQSEPSNLMIPQHVSRGNVEVANHFPSVSSKSSLGPQPMYLQQSLKTIGKSTTVRTSSSFVDQGQNCCQMSGKKTLKFPKLPKRPINGAPFGNSEAMLRPTKRRKMESSFNITNSSSDQWTPKMIQPLDIKNSVIDDTLGQSFKNEIIRSKGSKDGKKSEESDLTSHVKVDRSNLETVTRLNASKPTLSDDPITANIDHIHGKHGVSDITEQFRNPIHDSMRDVIMNNADDDLFGKTFNSETIPSKLFDDGKKLEESDRSHDIVDSSNLETVTRLNASMATLSSDPIAADIDHIHGKHAVSDISEQFKSPMPESVRDVIMNNVDDDLCGQTFKSETVHSKGLEAGHLSEESDPSDHDTVDSSNIKETEVILSSSNDTLIGSPIAADEDVINGRAEAKLGAINSEKMETKLSNETVNIVSLTQFMTRNQIIEHMTSLRKQPIQSIPGEETGISDNKCQLCNMEKLSFAPVPIYCLCCGKRIRRNINYYHKKPEESDTPNCFCTPCYQSRGDHITFNAISVPKAILDKKKNDEEHEEGWVECSKCRKWQHEICGLYNKKKDLDSCAVYTCPICHLKEIEEGTHVPLPKSAIFGAKNLPSTMLSNHIEKRLFKCLKQEKVDWEKFKGTKNLDEALAAENLYVKVVLSVDKELEVKKQFLDIIPEQDYPAEFSYRSKVILLFQKIHGADVCLFGLYVQEFGSECGNPNQRCVYISYLDSVKYFRPKRETVLGEALRTQVYHEILIGYLDFCKKRGFTTCYLWACPPKKGEDYILYCHPNTQKTPKNNKLRHWYLSMIRKAAEENIVVGLSNVYDHFFVPTEKLDSKVTASRLPYFDGDYLSARAMDLAWYYEKESRGEYEKTMNELMSKRALKAMGHENPSKDTAKDILVMRKLGENVFPFKENFMIIQLQHTCMHCQEVIVSGKRWFCAECKKFQECERCHSADSHTSISGEKHKLCQVFMEEIPFDTKDNDIILDNELFENRHNFLSFCQKNHLQFDTLRHAKYSSMMILHELQSHAQLTDGTKCSICGEHDPFQDICKCETCPEFTVCSACYKERGAECHAHKLSQINSISQSVSRNENAEQKAQRMKDLLEVLQHASQCNNSSETQPCSHLNCVKLKNLLFHARRCRRVHVPRGCISCKKAKFVLTTHLKTCRVSHCHVPCCMTLKKRKWVEMQSESRHRAAAVESKKTRHIASVVESKQTTC